MSSTGAPTTFNISDIVVTDSFPYYFHSWVTPLPEIVRINSQDPAVVYASLKHILGGIVDSIFSLPSNSNSSNPSSQYNNDSGKLLLSTFPSIKLACPNLYEYISQTTTFALPFLIIPSLKVALYGLTNELGNCTIWTIEDGVATKLNNASGPLNSFDPYATTDKSAEVLFYCYKGDSSEESLRNIDNYCSWKIIWDGQMKRVSLASYLWGSTNSRDKTSGLNAIFGSNFSPPDFGIPDDPFGPGGNSGEGPDTPGTFDNESDAIPMSPIPTLSMSATGFTRIYNPTLAQLNTLAEYLWKTDSILETIWNKVKQVFDDPMDVLISLNLVPVPVPNGAPVDFTVLFIPTGVSLSPATTQFVDVDCGTLALEGYYGSALDYSPYTRVQCYLPYIGMVTLDTDEVMNHTLAVKYRVDIVSGGCVATISVDGNVMYQYSGHCAISIPFSASDYSQYLNAMLQVGALAIGAAGASGAAAAAETTGALAMLEQQTGRISESTTITNTVRNPATGRQITSSTQTIDAVRDVPPRRTSTTDASFAGLSPANVANTVGQVMTGKPVASHSGAFNGNTGYLGVRYPYVIIQRPRQCLPSNYQKLNGYPSMITLKLGDCTGYTRVQQVQLTGIHATNPEQAEILQLLKGGVVF